MYVGYKSIQHLESNEIAGPITINPVVDFINGIRTRTGQFIVMNPNGRSIDIDFDAMAYKEWLGTNDFELLSDFRCEITDSNNIQCSAGHVFFPSEVVSISAKSATSCHYGYYMYARIYESGGTLTGELRYDNGITHTLQPESGENPDRVTLPICRTYQSGGEWKISYFHIGAFSFIQDPYFWIKDYDRSKHQVLGHTINGSMRWIDTGDCSGV